MNLQKRKRGIAFLGEHTVKIVIAAICILFLVILAVKLYYMFKSDSDLEKAKKSMDILEGRINSLLSYKNIEPQSVVLFPPKNWYLNSYGYGSPYWHPPGECAGSYACLCLCEDPVCNGVKRVCKGFGDEIRVAAEFNSLRTINQDVIELELIYAKDEYRGDDKILIQLPSGSEPKYSYGCNSKEVFNTTSGVCECDADNGWTSFSNPWRSQKPPCQWNNEEDRKPLDKGSKVD